MTEEKDKRKFMVGGYEFTSKEDAQIAKDELNAIKYVSSKTNSKDPKQVYSLYNKIIERKLFSTQIGMNYLKSLQTFLYKVVRYRMIRFSLFLLILTHRMRLI